ncbi:hypothetical protein ACHAXT_002464 [Thalassiosira profunda]
MICTDAPSPWQAAAAPAAGRGPSRSSRRRAVALSLAPPRAPPHGSVHRTLYTTPHGVHRHLAQDQNRREAQRADAATDEEGEGGYQSHTLPSRVLQLLYGGSPRRRRRPLLSSHPHLPTSLSTPSRPDALPRHRPATGQPALSPGRGDLPKDRRWDGRADLSAGGGGAPEAGPRVAGIDVCTESEAKCRGKAMKGKRWARKRISYDSHPMQRFDLFLPFKSNRLGDDKRIPVRGTLFFVHGGAWGAGKPWMYRLVAPAFLKLGFAVVIAGYRTYPDASTIDEQGADVRAVWDECEHVLNELVVPIDDGPDGSDWVGNVIMGHSSGAHVSLLLLVDLIAEKVERLSPSGSSNAKQGGRSAYPWTPDFFVGLSGPYDISYHFDYEAGRGVEQISPMKPICGHSRENFHKANPMRRLRALLAKQKEDIAGTIPQLFPPVLLVHGIEDSTVPFTATSDAGRMLRSSGVERCEEMYLEETGHQEVVMHFMLGGPAKDLAMDWLLRGAGQKGVATMQSRL